MKPIVIEVERKNGKIVNLTVEDLKQMLDDAYDQGYKDRGYYWWNSYPVYTTTTDKITINGTGTPEKWWDGITVSAEDLKDTFINASKNSESTITTATTGTNYIYANGGNH